VIKNRKKYRHAAREEYQILKTIAKKNSNEK